MFKNVNVIFKDNVNEKSYYDNTLGKKIMINDICLGEIIVLNKVMTNKLAKKKCVVMVDIDFDLFVTLSITTKLAQEVSKYPIVTLDYTIINDKKCWI